MASYLAEALNDSRIERRAKSGAKDRGDVTGLLLHGKRCVVECKDCTRTDLPKWLSEAETERGNDDAAFGVVAHKRKGKGSPEDQYVTMTLKTFAAICAGGPELLEGDENGDH